MANIRIDLEATVTNGQALTFKSPADCSQVTGLIIYYPVGNTTTSKTFKFVDAHGVDVGSGEISLFAENVLVKVILDTESGKAYVQNADTNAYLEGRLDSLSEHVDEHSRQIDILDSRMDTFASLPNGSTTGDAELADIRVGHDGNKYKTAGDAVRGQVGKLSEEIDKLSDVVGNRLEISENILTSSFFVYEYPLTSGKTYFFENVGSSIITDIYGKTGATTGVLYNSGANGVLRPNAKIEFTSENDYESLMVWLLEGEQSFRIYPKESLIDRVSTVEKDAVHLRETVGEIIQPNATISNFSYPAAQVAYTDILLDSGRRYTIAFNKDFSGSISAIGCIKSGTWAGVTTEVNNVATFVTSNDGRIAIATNKAITGGLIVYDTTDNDDLRTFVEENGFYSNETLYGGTLTEMFVKVEKDQPNVMILGDSQTQRGYFSNVFKSLYSANNNGSVEVYGYGGEGSIAIAEAQGGLSLYVKPFTIPSDTTPTEITLYSDADGVVVRYAQNNIGFTGITVGGVMGAITCVNNKNYFARSTSGDSVVIDRPERVKSNYYANVGRTLIIEVGTNDRANEASSVVILLKSVIDSIINHNNSDKYIVLGLTSKAYNSSVSEINAELAKHFGEHFLDIRTYLLNYGLADAGITPTEDDERAISGGEIPPSLLDDIVHFNSSCGSVIANQIYKKGKELDYWK